MESERRAAVVRALEESGEVFQRAAGAMAAHAGVKPGPDAWSVLEIAEHMALAESGMFRLLQAAEQTEQSRESAEREAFIAHRAVSREVRMEAPERARPLGRFADMAEALGRFTAAREQTILFAKETATDLFRLRIAHPLMGDVNGYELLLIMAGHARRHAAQIEETKSPLG